MPCGLLRWPFLPSGQCPWDMQVVEPIRCICQLAVCSTEGVIICFRGNTWRISGWFGAVTGREEHGAALCTCGVVGSQVSPRRPGVPLPACMVNVCLFLLETASVPHRLCPFQSCQQYRRDSFTCSWQHINIVIFLVGAVLVDV